MTTGKAPENEVGDLPNASRQCQCPVIAALCATGSTLLWSLDSIAYLWLSRELALLAGPALRQQAERIQPKALLRHSRGSRTIQPYAQCFSVSRWSLRYGRSLPLVSRPLQAVPVSFNPQLPSNPVQPLSPFDTMLEPAGVGDTLWSSFMVVVGTGSGSRNVLCCVLLAQAGRL